MGFWKRIGRSGKAAVLLAAGLAGGAAAVAVATVPGPDGVIHACYSVVTTGTTTEPAPTTPNLRIIDPSLNQTCATTGGLAGGPGTERTIDWNQQGPPGQTGPTGPAGTPGTPGQQGGKGPQGPVVTVANGHTLTLAGGQVLTVSGGNGVTVTSPPVSPGHVAGQATLGTGRQALTFNIAELNFATGAHGAGGGGGAGKVAVHDISITKKVDKSSATLFKFCATGKHFPTVTITLRKAGKGQQVYLTITLTNVLISSYQTGGHADQPTESLSLNFTKIEYKYVTQ